MNAIECRGLTKRYGEKTVVDRLDLTIFSGELFALLGINGAGKTTTIKMLTGLAQPTAGDALVFGHSILGEMDAIRPRINISLQETAVAYQLTVRENLELMAGIYGMDKKMARQTAADMMESLGLLSVEKEKAKVLSGGWQRRLSIAMALISKPEILFLDEPTLGLDVLARRELWELIRSLKGKTTVILTTHYLEEAEMLADRIGIMAHGVLRAVGTATELMEKSGSPNFEDAFVALATGKEAF